MMEPDEYSAAFFGAIDDRDWEFWRSLVTPEIVVRFANRPPIDASAFEAMVDGGAQLIPRVDHRITETWRHERPDGDPDGDVVIAEMEVTYDLANGANHVLPAVGVIRRRHGLAHDYRVFVDLGPVQASLGLA